jgi:hypothetical protein
MNACTYTRFLPRLVFGITAHIKYECYKLPSPSLLCAYFLVLFHLSVYIMPGPCVNT